MMSENLQTNEFEHFICRIQQIVDIVGGPSAMSEKSGLARRTINAYMAGETDPSRERILALAKASGVRPEWLLTGEDPQKIGDPPKHSRPQSSVDVRLLASCINLVDQVILETRRTLNPERKGRLIAEVYDLSVRQKERGNSEPPSAEIIPFIRVAIS